MDCSLLDSLLSALSPSPPIRGERESKTLCTLCALCAGFVQSLCATRHAASGKLKQRGALNP